MPRHWYLKTRRRVVGPITSKQLIGLAAQGKLQPCHGVSSDGESWIKAKSIAGLVFIKPTGLQPTPVTSAKPEAPEPDASFRIWIKTSRGTAGPFTHNKAQRLIQEGRIRPNSPASRNGKSWGRADRFKEFGFSRDDTVSQAAVSIPTLDPSPLPEPDPALSREPDPALSPEPDPALSPEPDPALLRRRWMKSHFQSSLTVHAEDANGIEVLCFAPTQIRPFATLMTNGLSAAVGPSGTRNELVMYVSQQDADCVALLRYVAMLVNYAKRQTKIDIGVGAVIPNGNPAQPIAANSHLKHFLFLPPPIAMDANLSIPSYTIGHADAEALWLHPITTAEKTMRFSQGLASLVSRMHLVKASCVLDFFRQDVTEPAVAASAWTNPTPVSGSSLTASSTFGAS
jgi:hypothetical protein